MHEIRTHNPRPIGIAAWSAAACLACSIGLPALSADLWIEPDEPDPAPGRQVGLLVVEGDAFEGTEVALDDGRFDRFQRIWRSGRENLEAEPAQTPPASFTAETSGVHVVVLSTAARQINQRGDTVARFAKALIVVGDAAQDDAVRLSETGQALELVPRTDPVTLRARGGYLEVQLLRKREPLPGAQLTAVPRAAPRKGRLTATTDELGMARFKLDRPGLWMIRAEYSGRCEECAEPAWRILSSTLTLGVKSAR